MQDWVELLIAFILGFFAKHLLGTVCQSRLVEGGPIQRRPRQHHPGSGRSGGDGAGAGRSIEPDYVI